MVGASPQDPMLSRQNNLRTGTHCRRRDQHPAPAHTRSEASSASPMGCASPTTMLSTPRGSPARSASAPSASAVSGVSSEGLSTTYRQAGLHGAGVFCAYISEKSIWYMVQLQAVLHRGTAICTLSPPAPQAPTLTVQPAAKAVDTLRVIMLNGKFLHPGVTGQKLHKHHPEMPHAHLVSLHARQAEHRQAGAATATTPLAHQGVMAPTTPTGCLNTRKRLWRVGEASTSPFTRLASSANQAMDSTLSTGRGRGRG